MKLNSVEEILEGLVYDSVELKTDLMISSVEIDSRKVVEGGMFVALEGTKMDGHDFIHSAIGKGAKVVLCSMYPEEFIHGVSYVRVNDSNEALARIASNFWGDPSSKMKLIGVTGTNGKTTIATLLYELITKLGFKAGLLSTIENQIAGKVYPSTHTTPDLLSTNELMAKMVESGCDYAVMEVSSHAIDQGRIGGLDFDGGIFTNLTVDHLDYHNSFKEYVYTKKKFFDLLKPKAFALTNVDDKNGLVMLQNSAAKRLTYALKQMADYKGIVLRNSLEGLQMKINGQETFFKLIGSFNAYNLLAVYGAARLLEFDDEEVRIAMSALEPAQGRFEIVPNVEKGVMAIIDYAHTADALQNVLKTINALKDKSSQIITLAGAGGDRDRSKRPEMGRVAASMSDSVIFTSDNPRSEDPDSIISDMVGGVKEEDIKKVLKVVDRAEAIRVATKIASRGDIILIAGKGHETYQEVKGKRHPFDDKTVLKNIWF